VKTERVNGPPIRCYDNEGETFDRYTVVYLDQPQCDLLFAAVGMNRRPFHPLGFGQHCCPSPGRHLGQHICFAALPQDCQRVVATDLTV
jgi:hypothetical protein